MMGEKNNGDATGRSQVWERQTQGRLKYSGVPTGPTAIASGVAATRRQGWESRRAGCAMGSPSHGDSA